MMTSDVQPLSVSVVIPAYRAAGTIKAAIDSLLRQTRLPDEILVIDDGSPDNLRDVLAPYGSLVTLVRKPNGGAASARNMGLNRAGGDWVGFLDADDFWEPTKLERQLDIIRRHPEADLVSTRWFEQWPGRPRVPVFAGGGGDDRFYGQVVRAAGEDVIRVALLLWTSAVLVRKRSLGPNQFESGLEPAEDLDMWIRLVAMGSVYVIADHLATYVQSAGSLSNSDVHRDCRNMLRVVQRHAKLLGPGGTKRWECYLFRRWAGALLSTGDASAAIAPALKRLRRSPLSPSAWWIVIKSVAMAARQRRPTAGILPGVTP